MKSLTKVLLAVLLLAGLVATQENASSADHSPAYNPAQQVMFRGTVREFKDYQCPVSGTIGSHITVSNGYDTIEVHLAPATFLKHNQIVLRPGDEVKVFGAMFMFERRPAMLARTVVTSDKTFTFRNDRGAPAW
ncbi:MAG TPA: hypothetical protein VKW06_17440 [Candidatus Angelobacter sp.]|nr:hypothetical protein [Candidatus Angelobacter sp.]